MLAALIATRNQFFILPATLPNGIVGIPYNFLLMASGGFFPFTWVVIVGTLPFGLTLNPTTGLISGTPTTPGTSTFTVQVTDAHGATATAVFTLTVVLVRYGNQLVAATTTFLCITLAKIAASLSTNPSYSYQLLFSTPGHESMMSKLNRMYYLLIGPQASTDPIFLSDTIISVIETAVPLNALIQALPVAPSNAGKLADIQQRMGVALRLLQSLSIPITLDYT